MKISSSSPRKPYTGSPESPRTSASANPDTLAQADNAVPPPPDEPHPDDVAGAMPSVQARGRAESEPLPPPEHAPDDEPDWDALAGRGRDRAAGESPGPATVPAKPGSLSEYVAARSGILRVHHNPAAAAALKGLRKQGTLNAADVQKANEIERARQEKKQAMQEKKQERELAFEVAERNYNDAYAKASPKQQEEARTYLLSTAYQRSNKSTELGTANIARKDRGKLSDPAQAIVSTAEMLNIARAAMTGERARQTSSLAMRHEHRRLD